MSLLPQLNWITGRQNSGYEKLLLAQGKSFDLYLLRFRKGAFVHSHMDEVDNKNHFRINIDIIRAKLGGLFVCEKTIFNLGRVVVFRPDQAFHALTKVEDGVLYMLSFGFVTNKGNTNA